MFCETFCETFPSNFSYSFFIVVFLLPCYLLRALEQYHTLRRGDVGYFRFALGAFQRAPKLRPSTALSAMLVAVLAGLNINFVYLRHRRMFQQIINLWLIPLIGAQGREPLSGGPLGCFASTFIFTFFCATVCV